MRAIETGPGYPTTADQGSMFCSEPSVVPCLCEVCFVAEIEALKCKTLALALNDIILVRRCMHSNICNVHHMSLVTKFGYSWSECAVCSVAMKLGMKTRT